MSPRGRGTDPSRRDTSPQVCTGAVSPRIEDTREEYFKLRFQFATGQLTDYSRFKKVRRDIARLPLPGLPHLGSGISWLRAGRRVMAICGDGGFMMNSQEMETAVRMEMNFVVLVLRDDAYGMIKWKQRGMGLPDFGLDYTNPDFVAYAEAYGAYGHRLGSADELVPVMEACFSKGGVHLVEVPVDYSSSEKILNEVIKEKSKRV